MVNIVVKCLNLKNENDEVKQIILQMIKQALKLKKEK